MIDKDISRNASGYFDETAYKAIKNIKKGAGKMDIYNGDILTVEYNGIEKFFVVIAVKETFFVGLQLNPNNNSFRQVKVICQGEKYCDPAMLAYVYSNKVTGLIRSMTAAEFEDILGKVGDAIGIPVHDFTEKKTEIISVPAETSQKPEEDSFDLRMQIVSLRTERDVYKQLYAEMMNSLYGGK